MVEICEIFDEADDVAAVIKQEAGVTRNRLVVDIGESSTKSFPAARWRRLGDALALIF
jgi:hypothetical protein